MNRTKIEWTDYTWNPITGCKHGCWYCYAEKLSKRFKKIFPNGFEPTFYPDRLKEPYCLLKPSKIFVCSIADLFADWTPQEWRDEVLASVFHCSIKHTFQLLTKSPEGIEKFVRFPENVWVGATVTSEKDAHNISMMTLVDAKIRFISFEPLLGLIDFNTVHCLDGIQWVIVGKLTGSKKVKLEPFWVWEIMRECERHDIPLFMKDNLGFENSVQEFPKIP